MPPLKKEMLEELVKYLEDDVSVFSPAINRLVIARRDLNKRQSNPRVIQQQEQLKKDLEAFKSRYNLAQNLLSFSKKMLQEEIELQEVEHELNQVKPK